MVPLVSVELGAFESLLVKLNGLLDSEYGRLKVVRREIRYLESEVTSLHAALRRYTYLEDPDEQVKAWISLARELSYDTEDVFDEFLHNLGKGRGHRGSLKEFLSKIALILEKLGVRSTIAHQINNLKVRTQEVKELKDCYKLDDIRCNASGRIAMDPRLYTHFGEEKLLVGVDGPRDDLVNWMMEEENNSSEHQKVLSIVGFGGVGKTTLANEVYHKIRGDFECCAFVSISQKPDIKRIIKDVINQVCPYIKDIEIWDEIAAIETLRDLLKDKRYLIIIDDIWSIAAWEAIKYAFPENNNSSRIIVTTRIVDVAKSCCLSRGDRMYEMEVLSDLYSRRLFFDRIFGSENCCPDVLKEVSIGILKKCGGLPLAIISMSSLLATRPAVKEEWEKVKRSIGSELENSRSLEGMNRILSLSYNDLPPSLKTCLLYLSVFPEDYVIERERLVRRWIAEGFISQGHSQSQEEIAERYFYELINKNIVQPIDIGYDGKAHACRVPYVMLEIITLKSAEDNFMTVVGGGQRNMANRHGFIRRLSIQHIDQELASALANEDLSHVRSLTITSSCSMKHLPSLAEFKALRVLDFEGCQGLEGYVMNNMDKLFKLKYLGLRDTGISKLPPGILMLVDLETIDLETIDLRGTSVHELTSGIVRLRRLQHLFVAVRTETADALEGLKNLTSLEKLSVFFESEGSNECKQHGEMLLSLLGKLGTCKLKSLWIHKWRGSLEFLDSWSPLPSSLENFRMSGGCYFMNIPKWISTLLHSLAYLEISLTESREEDLHTLGELPALRYLKLSFIADPIERITVQGTSGFLYLKEFVIYSVAGAYVNFMEGAMPSLEKLNVRLHVSLAKNYGFNLGIQHLPYLKEAVVSLYKVDVTPSEINAAAAAIRNEACDHPNHPTIDISGESYEKHNEEIGSYVAEIKEVGETSGSSSFSG